MNVCFVYRDRKSLKSTGNTFQRVAFRSQTKPVDILPNFFDEKLFPLSVATPEIKFFAVKRNYSGKKRKLLDIEVANFLVLFLDASWFQAKR